MAPQIPLDFSDIRRLAITAIFADDYLFERVVLKGGNALSLALGIGDRTSLDLDFSIENDFEDLPEAERHLKAALERAIPECRSRCVRLQIRSKARHSERRAKSTMGWLRCRVQADGSRAPQRAGQQQGGFGQGSDGPWGLGSKDDSQSTSANLNTPTGSFRKRSITFKYLCMRRR